MPNHKINKTHAIVFVLSWAVTVGLVFLIFGCSPQYHHDKAVKKGYVYTCDTTTVTIHDTIKGKDGKDSIVERFVNILVPTATPPLTRYEVRYKYKTEKIYVKQAVAEKKQDTKQIEAKVKEVIQVTKSNNKTGFWYRMQLVGLGILIGAIATFILFVLYLAKRK